MKTINKDYDCSCWNDYPNEMHRYRGQKPYKSCKWKCVDCYGNKAIQTEVLLTEDDYAEVKSKGYYLA